MSSNKKPDCFIISGRFNQSLGEKKNTVEGIGQVPAVIVFGDSLVDVGNNNHLKLSILKSNFPHNGIDYPNHKATGRYSNGKNAADFFSENLGLAASPPYLSIKSASDKVQVLLDQGGINFASGGAGILNETNKLFKQAISLSEQITHFTTLHGVFKQQLGTVQAQTYLEKSVFLIAIGSNDILDKFKGVSLSLQPESSGDEFINSLMVVLKSKLKTIYNLGARKFALVGLGMIGCCPKLRRKNPTGECNEQANYWSVKYNKAVKSLLQELKEELTDINYSLINTYDIMANFLQQPALYGFSEIKSACCGAGKFRAKVPCLPIAVYCKNRRDHVFWDLYHPTEAATKIIMNEFFMGTEKYVYPVNLKQLLEI
ncbi:GDSL esterase/lipase At5g55050-like [Papaver somniferum]|uniref:GDSL esterase/lipase At5g55050-like n=1 Tax=Papaver somniferum TaxID=3469 RepID=UPI000E704DF1|nr:GDSL esterase/lipase At5g55050-like [Papaver somniferum]